MAYPVYVVDDERDSRVSTSVLLNSCGFQCRPFQNGPDFLGSISELRPGVILLRVRSADAPALAFLEELRERRLGWAVVALADEIAVCEAVALMKLGLSDVIEKPVKAPVLLEALQNASNYLAANVAASDRVQRSRAQIETLSPRELEVLRALLAGYTNKRVAEHFNISVRTVEMHRANMIERLGVDTLVGAAQLACEAGVEPLHRDVA